MIPVVNTPLVVITDHGFPDVELERRLIEGAGARLRVAQCRTGAQVIQAAEGADILLVQWAPVTADVIAALDGCRLIVRCGIGVDNVDLPAAKARGIPVCNVPDYGTEEVADHAVSLAVALARQLPMIDRRVREGLWKITPPAPMPAFNEMTFATAGLGRIARAVLRRAAGFGFQPAAFDPHVPDEAFATAGARRIGSVDQLFREADILSLHLPLNDQTRHLVNAQRLLEMKRHAVLVNTARGGLVDAAALANALNAGTIAAAGLDVFEQEPLPSNHPIRDCPNALLTSHVAWYSESSVPRLRRLAAEEVVRGLRGEPLKNQVN